MAEPFLKFFTSDWRSDPRLKMCSAGARGVWIEMICLMHEANPYGHLLVHGQPPNEAQLASLTGIPIAELTEYLGELERMGVFSTTREGVIYSRKLVRMKSKSAKARKNGKKGGNPSLGNKKGKSKSVKPPDKGLDKPQSPEARSQRDNNSEDKSSSLLSARLARDDDGYQQFLEAHPKPRETARGEQAWQDAVNAGNSPESLIDAARRYADVARSFDPDKVKFSDNWLSEGTWRRYPPKTAKAHDEAEILDFWASKIKGGKAFGLSDEMAARCRAAGLVSDEEIRAATTR
ncbi:hypothetical protein GQE99_14550 [Maritimibacter sp. DP07]|uniref:Uncharacterized protein n=1 Tax=Maritimibacter harenae TaxID=2606218 RepID=A0A845M1K4_9RHOB|nr:hypothetical protein [Maritimibacter harenae]MZR14240.1 hypothetical protein [Maritimibacter harenae]